MWSCRQKKGASIETLEIFGLRGNFLEVMVVIKYCKELVRLPDSDTCEIE